MSVLNNIVRERQEWINRQKAIATRYSHAKVVTEYVMTVLFLTLPYIVFLYWDRITALLKGLLF
jgi:hypothetical protein